MGRKRTAILLWCIRTVLLYLLACTAILPLVPSDLIRWLMLSVLTGMTAMACGYIQLYIRGFSVRASAAQIEIKSGVFVRKSVVLPLTDRIFTDIRTTPVERKLGLCRMRIYGRGKAMRLWCLTLDKAKLFQPSAEGK